MTMGHDNNSSVVVSFPRFVEHVQDYLQGASSVSLSLIDLEGRVVYMNQGFRDIIEPDYSPEDVTSCFITPSFEFFIQETKSKGQAEVYEGLLTLGTMLKSQTYKAKVISHLSQLLFICEYDVNELDYINDEMRRLNQELNESQRQLIRKKNALAKSISDLKAAQAKLIESEKMASLGRMVAGFAHEINTPIGIALTASSSIADSSQYIEFMLSQEEVEEEDLVSTLETIRDASKLVLSNLNRSADLVGRFKRTSIDQSYEKSSLYCLNDTIEDVLANMQIKIRNSPIETLFRDDEKITLYGNPGDLFQVLSNMVENSLLHGFDEGTMSGTISIALEQVEGEILIHYSDTGKGMTSEVVGQVFEPFYTTSRARGGTGLGLYICHNIVTNRLNGMIDCSSVAGEGTKFVITIPQVEVAAHEIEAEEDQ